LLKKFLENFLAKVKNYSVTILYNNLGLIFGPPLSQNSRLDRLLDININLAMSKGLVFKRPSIWLVNGDSLLNYVYERSRTLGQALSGDNCILIYPLAFCSLDDATLEIVIAHELGHIIDEQTKRQGHPIFDNLRHLDKEMFAHAIAAYIHSKISVITALNTAKVQINRVKFFEIILILDPPAPT